MKNITVIGAGKLGLPMGACFADASYKVNFYDSSKSKIDNLRDNNGYNYEINLNKILNKNSKNISFTSDLNKAYVFSNFFFIILPTPSLKNGDYSLKYLKIFLKKFCELLKKNPKNVNIIITSTVMPGACDDKIIPFLKKQLPKKIYNKIHLYYSPEFIALGSVVNDLQRPKIILVGSNNKNKRAILSKFYKSIVKNNPLVFETNLITAELTKILINSFMTIKISFSNFVGLLSNKDVNLDSKLILNSIKAFNINNKKGYLSGVGYSGPCLPRDNRAVAYFAKSKNVNPLLSNSADKINKNVNENLYSQIKKYSKNLKNILFLGVSYKEQTSVIEESPVIRIARRMKKNYNISIYDPLVNMETDLSEKFLFSDDLEEVLKKAELIVVSHTSVKLDKFRGILKNKKIFKIWGNEYSIGLNV